MKEEMKEDVYNQLIPAFEELFDKVEDGILNILMEAWTVLVDRDKKSFLQVSTFFLIMQILKWHTVIQITYTSTFFIE